jgi:beta-lactamase class A
MLWMTRRAAVAASLAAAATPVLGSPPPNWAPLLEKHFGGRLGVAVLDTANGQFYAYRGNERFLMCSVFKLLAVGAVLSRADKDEEKLLRHISYGKADLLPVSPVTTAHVDAGYMTLGDLCGAAATYSDNTAANLILKALGGPDGVTRYARALGDTVTHLDRMEPDLNRSAGPNDQRDTTSPKAMLDDLNALTLGNALSRKSRDMMTAWLAASTTGNQRIKAGVPADWRVASKTGTGESTNDVCVLWPSGGRPPIVVAAFYVNPKIALDARENVLMEVGRAVAANFG